MIWLTAVILGGGERGRRDGQSGQAGGQSEDGAADAAAFVRAAIRRTGWIARSARRTQFHGRTDGPLPSAQCLHRMHQSSHEQFSTLPTLHHPTFNRITYISLILS